MAALTKKITPSEDVDSFYAKYVAMLEEAEIGDMTKEELHGMLMIIALEPIRDLMRIDELCSCVESSVVEARHFHPGFD